MRSEQKNLIFMEMNKHLTEDAAPSEYFEEISSLPWFTQPPFNALSDLKNTRQSPQHHPEGSAWAHTMMVLDEAAAVKHQSKDPVAFMWAALLHDIGKTATTRIRKGKITSYDHDKLGAAMVRDFFEGMQVDRNFTDKVAALVRWHMQILFVVNGLPFADVVHMSQEVDLDEVALLGLCDRMGRTGADRGHEEENIRIFLQKCSRG